ncbi:hypothetical protein HMPREF1986_02462 [Oribacterium sp. oral taxon 078 str. F0263]|nr:hypothetical protein HMPREF1986_02462 [Oribacterium sp. oral taxon 078 str. F0263]
MRMADSPWSGSAPFHGEIRRRRESFVLLRNFDAGTYPDARLFQNRQQSDYRRREL